MDSIKSRQGEYIDVCTSDKALEFLYGTVIGRVLLKLVARRFVSRIVGVYMNSRLSKIHIKKTVKRIGIDLSDYEKSIFLSYNDFFTRKIKSEKRPIDKNPESFISPCDAKVCVYRISDKSLFYIKNSVYSVKTLLGDNNELASKYNGGYCLIFRLTVDDYHRYSYIDNGKKSRNVFIPGLLHTVKPIALEKYNIYKQNCREYTVLDTDNFGQIVQIEVGAMMVGKINNLHQSHSYKKGEEKGFFEFGGSTIVLLVKENVITIDSDILKNSAENIETVVRLGERIAVKN